ncbi:hypothetical protein ANN_03794 [Periplaneta americana]|uniref:Uncharacterized protein n=1 Tax=Periplaneta americana TaxID=6978 RepID=A0ABQ8TZU3_PERAM|nr:hypothetical protein ANN_03794 [Periplaneta americana]
MEGLCEGGNEPPGSLKATCCIPLQIRASDTKSRRIGTWAVLQTQAAQLQAGLYSVSHHLESRTRLLSGFVKDILYSQKPRNIDVRIKITQAFQQITPLMLQRTWAELHHRYELCRVRNGGHVEL